MSEIKELSKDPEKVVEMEVRAKAWMKKVSDVLKESEQIRKENNSSGDKQVDNFSQKLNKMFNFYLGPQDELEYWKKRGAQFSQTITYLEEDEVQLTVLLLELGRSKILKQWQEMSNKITFCYNEAKDNAKYIQAMEKNCHSLYLDDPVNTFNYF